MGHLASEVYNQCTPMSVYHIVSIEYIWWSCSQNSNQSKYVWGFLSFPKKTSSWLSMIGGNSGQEGRRSQPYPMKQHFPQKIWISVPHKSWKDILNKNASLVIHPGNWTFWIQKWRFGLDVFHCFSFSQEIFRFKMFIFQGVHSLKRTNRPRK